MKMRHKITFEPEVYQIIMERTTIPHGIPLLEEDE